MGLFRHMYFNHSDFPLLQLKFPGTLSPRSAMRIGGFYGRMCGDPSLWDLQEILTLKPDSDWNANSQITHQAQYSKYIYVYMYICRLYSDYKELKGQQVSKRPEKAKLRNQ